MTVELTVWVFPREEELGESFFSTARGKHFAEALDATVAFLRDGWDGWAAEVHFPDGSRQVVDQSGWELEPSELDW